VDVPESDPKKDEVRHAAAEVGAASFCRGEGAFFGAGKLHLAATSGGKRGRGQVFRLTPTSGHDQLELLAEASGEDTLDCPDNVTLSPHGDVIIAEDGSGDNFVRGLTPDGRVYDLARNAASSFETTGVCFSPDGSTLFLNLQVDGITLGVRGPFATLATHARVG